MDPDRCSYKGCRLFVGALFLVDILHDFNKSTVETQATWVFSHYKLTLCRIQALDGKCIVRFSKTMGVQLKVSFNRVCNDGILGLG